MLGLIVSHNATRNKISNITFFCIQITLLKNNYIELYQEIEKKSSCSDMTIMFLWEGKSDCVSFLPQVVPATEDEVGFRVQGGAHLPQAAVTAGTFETVFMPVFVQGLEQVAVFNLPIAASTPLLLPFGLDREHRHTCSDKETNSNAWFTAREHEWLFRSSSFFW